MRGKQAGNEPGGQTPTLGLAGQQGRNVKKSKIWIFLSDL